MNTQTRDTSENNPEKMH